jgi:hypothetical protein
MRIAAGKVVNGRVEVDGELPEGVSVTVLAPEAEETFEADPETEQMLLEAIAQCRRGQVTPLKDFLRRDAKSRVSRPVPVDISDLAKAQNRAVRVRRRIAAERL